MDNNDNKEVNKKVEEVIDKYYKIALENIEARKKYDNMTEEEKRKYLNQKRDVQITQKK